MISYSPTELDTIRSEIGPKQQILFNRLLAGQDDDLLPPSPIYNNDDNDNDDNDNDEYPYSPTSFMSGPPLVFQSPPPPQIPLPPPPQTSDEESASICSEYNVRGGVVKNNTNIYGKFGSHVNVYREIGLLVNIRDNNILKQRINEYKTKDSRDVKSKLGSPGKTGRKKEMADGIYDTIKALQRAYF